jgi:hypothetical protein
MFFLEIIFFVIPGGLLIISGLNQDNLSFDNIRKIIIDYDFLNQFFRSFCVIIIVSKIAMVLFLCFKIKNEGWIYSKILKWVANDFVSGQIILLLSGILLWFDLQINLLIWLAAICLEIVNGILLDNCTFL